MLKTNEKNIVEFLLQCQPGPPKTLNAWRVDHNGVPFVLPEIGGITLNLQAGDSAFGWEGDHVEPGVSCIADTHKPMEHPNVSLQTFSCAGNKAKIISGRAKGATGTVMGHHGGSEHLIIDFPRKVKEKLTYDDKIIVHAKGQGLQLLDYPEIKLMNLDPSLLKKMKIKKVDKHTIEVPVTTVVPPACIGAGLGAIHSSKGDIDFMTSDPESVKKYRLDKVKFGDFIAMMDHDNRYGRTYRKGAISIGIVIHSDCRRAGHGPGMAILMTCESSGIKPVIDSKANIADLLKIGTKRGK